MAKRSTKATKATGNTQSATGLKMYYALDDLFYHPDHQAVTWGNHGYGPRMAVHQASDCMYRVWDGYAWHALYNSSANEIAAYVGVDADAPVWEIQDLFV